MAQYKISGVWKTPQGVITHYAFHQVMTDHITRATKVAKVEAIKLLEINGNTAVTWTWNYKGSFWVDGEPVHIVNGNNGKFLRSNPDGKAVDNLSHLIDYDWLKP